MVISVYDAELKSICMYLFIYVCVTNNTCLNLHSLQNAHIAIEEGRKVLCCLYSGKFCTFYLNMYAIAIALVCFNDKELYHVPITTTTIIQHLFLCHIQVKSK